MRKAIPWLFFATLLAAMASIAVPNLLEARNRSFQKQSMADMRMLAMALEARATDTNTYGLLPSDTQVRGPVGDLRPLRRISHSELERALVPRYTESVPRYDAWKHEFDVRIAANTYVIRSLGSDGRAEAERYTQNKIFSRYEGDLVFSEGTFLQYPEGI